MPKETRDVLNRWTALRAKWVKRYGEIRGNSLADMAIRAYLRANERYNQQQGANS